MKIKIYASKELKQLMEEKGIKIDDHENGILNIITSSDNKNAMHDISSVITQILSDNRELSLVTMNTRDEPDGKFVAIATFISFLNIAYMMKDPGMYAVMNGLSKIWPPFG
jgi:hypothetical protein